MKLSKAIEGKLIKSGDFFKTKLDNWFLLKGTFFYHYDPVLEKQKGSANLCIDTLNLEGEIIRADPEVLTADQAWAKYRDVCLQGFSDLDSVPDAYKTGFADGEIKGQIKEWKRLKPLIDLAEEFLIKSSEGEEYFSVAVVVDWNKVFKQTLEDLNPPWEPEK